MSIENVIRAWKDSDYREGLSEAERALLPQHPAGLVELTEAELVDVAGGGSFTVFSPCLTRGNCTFEC